MLVPCRTSAAHGCRAAPIFTVNLLERRRTLLVDHVDVLTDAFRRTRADRSFETVAGVVLPDHLHWIWRLPAGDVDNATRWRQIKTSFSRAAGHRASFGASTGQGRTRHLSAPLLEAPHPRRARSGHACRQCSHQSGEARLRGACDRLAMVDRPSPCSRRAPSVDQGTAGR